MPWLHFALLFSQFGTIASYIACARMNSFFNSVGCPGGGNVICRMVLWLQQLYNIPFAVPGNCSL
jgi:hypothetical protein